MVRRLKIIVSFIVVVSMMMLLFHSSNESYQQQSLVPTLNQFLSDEPFKALLAHIEFNYAGRIISIEQVGYSHFIEFFIRKLAHFGSYFIMGGFTFFLLKQVMSNMKLVLVISWLIPTIYAITDELHQSFTPQRTPLWQDVVLDSLGALAGVLICWLFSKCKIKYYNIGR